MLIASADNRGISYRLVMVKRCGKNKYFVNSYNSTGLAASVKFKNLCAAYKYFKNFIPAKKNKSIINQNQDSLW